MRIDEVVETERGWELPLEGMRPIRIEPGIDYVDLVLVADDGGARVRLPDDCGEQAVSAVSSGTALRAAEASSEGALRLSFADGSEIEVPPDPQFEAWEVIGPGSVIVVSPAGGGEPAIWDRTCEVFTIEVDSEGQIAVESKEEETNADRNDE